jgi:hypothetical protein
MQVPTACVVARAPKSDRLEYCWSTGGAEYARDSAREVGLEDCFVSFLPKPTLMIDDQPFAEWRLCRCVHPFNVASIDTES